MAREVLIAPYAARRIVVASLPRLFRKNRTAQMAGYPSTARRSRRREDVQGFSPCIKIESSFEMVDPTFDVAADGIQTGTVRTKVTTKIRKSRSDSIQKSCMMEISHIAATQKNSRNSLLPS